jgi:hypothetical protein
MMVERSSDCSTPQGRGMMDHAFHTHPFLFCLWILFTGTWFGLVVGWMLGKLYIALYRVWTRRKNVAVSEQPTRVNDENGEK